MLDHWSCHDFSVPFLQMYYSIIHLLPCYELCIPTSYAIYVRYMVSPDMTNCYAHPVSFCGLSIMGCVRAGSKP